MDTLFHFSIAFIAGMAVNVKLNHKPAWVLAAAFSVVMIDIDHLLFSYPRAFHTVFVVFLVPALLFYTAYRYEEDSIKLQSLSLLIFVMLFSHLTTDLFFDGVLRPFYPLSNFEMVVNGFEFNFIRDNWSIATTEGFLLTLNGAIISLAYYSEEFIYLVEEKHEKVRKAAKDTFKA